MLRPMLPRPVRRCDCRAGAGARLSG